MLWAPPRNRCVRDEEPALNARGRRRVAIRAPAFRSQSGRFFGGTLAEIYEQKVAYKKEPATMDDLVQTSQRSEPALIRCLLTEVYHIVIMLTRRGAQRFVLKAVELGGWRRGGDDISGDLADGVVDSERRITAWERESQEARSDLMKIGLVVQG